MAKEQTLGQEKRIFSKILFALGRLENMHSLKIVSHETNNKCLGFICELFYRHFVVQRVYMKLLTNEVQSVN